MAPRHQEQTAFLNPDTAVSGLASDFEGTIVDAVYESWDFKGKAKPKQSGKSGVVMALSVTIGDRDDDEDDHVEKYPCGAIEDFVPADDGRSFESPTGKKGFFKDREVIQFVEAILKIGALKKSDLGVDPSIFVGKRCYWERQAPIWAKPGQETRSSVLVPTKFIGEAKGGKGKAAVAPASKRRRDEEEEEEERPSKAATARSHKGEGNGEVDDDVISRAVDLTSEVLEALPPKQKTITREELGSEVYTLMMGQYKKEIDKDTRKAIAALFDEDTFLDDNAGKKTWKYDAEDGEVTRV